jgi:hypothetical protein
MCCAAAVCFTRGFAGFSSISFDAHSQVAVMLERKMARFGSFPPRKKLLSLFLHDPRRKCERQLNTGNAQNTFYIIGWCVWLLVVPKDRVVGRQQGHPSQQSRGWCR